MCVSDLDGAVLAPQINSKTRQPDTPCPHSPTALDTDPTPPSPTGRQHLKLTRHQPDTNPTASDTTRHHPKTGQPPLNHFSICLPAGVVPVAVLRQPDASLRRLLVYARVVAVDVMRAGSRKFPPLPSPPHRYSPTVARAIRPPRNRDPRRSRAGAGEGQQWSKASVSERTSQVKSSQVVFISGL